MGPLDVRRGTVRRALLLLVLAAAPWLHWASGVTPPPAITGAGVALGATPAGADFLYAQPAEGISPAALAGALALLDPGVDAVVHRDGVRVRVAGLDAEATAAVAARLATSGLVRSVEGDAVVRAAQLGPEDEPPLEETPTEDTPTEEPLPDEPPTSVTPNDPLYRDAQAAYLEAIGAPAAWGAGADASGVLIAVIDTGIDYNHLDLVPRLAVNTSDDFFDLRDNDNNGCVDDVIGCNFVSLATADPSCGYGTEPPNWRTLDDEGHGTFVAGIAAATGNDEVGITGVAPSAMLLPVKVLDCTATGRISDAAAGIRYAVNMGADVINISFGTPNDSPALREAVEFAQSRGAIVVASAGNDGSRGITFPAAYPGVVSVAASGEEVVAGGALEYRHTAPFAEFGPGVDYLAPGVNLVSTIPTASCGMNQWVCVADGYAQGTGSSFATPIVSGAIALALAAYPDFTPEFALAVLEGTRHPELPGQLSRLLDVGAAVQREIFGTGAGGTSRATGGDPPGPAFP